MQKGHVVLLNTVILLFLIKSSTIVMGSVLGTTGAMLLMEYLRQGFKPWMSEKRCLLDKARTDFCFRYETLLLKFRTKKTVKTHGNVDNQSNRCQIELM